MVEKHSSVLDEINKSLKAIAEGQEQLLKDIRELRLEQKKLIDEMRENYLVLNNIQIRSEIIN